MLLSTSALLAAAVFVGEVAAHGYVPFIRINGTLINGWDVNTDGYATPQPVRVVRATKPDSGFISDVTSGDITCSIGNSKLPSAEITASVAAGGIVTAVWNTWPIGHYGPILNYIAKCPASGCSSWKADSGSPWIKISQETYDGEWPSDKLAKNGFTHDIKIPKNLAAGSYLIRHENLALHGASQPAGAQFYPVCIQITVTGGGSYVPAGNLNFPGAYKATDPGILFNPYQGDAANRAYIPPGGPVASGLQY
ncbi:glycoside hydrolase [Coprinellus micaceus]|uniref:lytic cellulose monooxygenase (C4-dehydrogenating) n=1 Tax=Coprinellus micaceus TaxID=71717 RepID=A0A4Y7TF86_COPMI|nr:glycoside hydrolase [Coprinellus micaceus]